MKKSFEPIKYKKMYESLLLAFLEKCLPESGRSLDIDGQHSFYMDIDNSFKGFWCMFDHDKIIGTVAVKELNDKSCELKSLYLLKQYHGKGYGKCLLQKAIVYAKEYGYENMYLDSLSTSKKAIALYRRSGFVDTERYNQNERSDIFMVLDLKTVSEEWLVMSIISSTDRIQEYIKEDDVIDYRNEIITGLADSLFQKAGSELEYIKVAYEYVRDNISHSADINEDIITCTASEVLRAGHGICFAKSHLLAALLRYKSIPTGFCYQKLILDDETAPVLIYHGLNGVYIKEYKKWIRLDARGNKERVNAQFSIDKEQLAFPVRLEKGEKDCFTVYPNPDLKVLEKLRTNKTRTELWNDLPTELEYDL